VKQKYEKNEKTKKRKNEKTKKRKNEKTKKLGFISIGFCWVVTLQPPLHNYHFTTTTLQLPFHNYHFTTTISQLPFHNYHFTTTISQLPFHNYHFTTTISHLPFHNYHFTTTISQLPFHNYQFHIYHFTTQFTLQLNSLYNSKKNKRRYCTTLSYSHYMEYNALFWYRYEMCNIVSILDVRISYDIIIKRTINLIFKRKLNHCLFTISNKFKSSVLSSFFSISLKSSSSS
jgi:hypothetical protein